MHSCCVKLCLCSGCQTVAMTDSLQFGQQQGSLEALELMSSIQRRPTTWMGLYFPIHLLCLYDLCLHVRKDPLQLTATSVPALLFLKSLSILWDRPRAWGDVRGGGRPSGFIVCAWFHHAVGSVPDPVQAKHPRVGGGACWLAGGYPCSI